MRLEYAIESLNEYARNGCSTGRLLRDLLESKVITAVIAEGDLTSLATLYETCKHIYGQLPGNCWGSPETVKHWLETKREQRLAAEAKT